MKQIQKPSIFVFIFLILLLISCGTPNPSTPSTGGIEAEIEAETDIPEVTTDNDNEQNTSVVEVENEEGNSDPIPEDENSTETSGEEPEPINNPSKKKPNIIIFYADDLGYQPECYGGEVAKTPHINKLAQNGILFKDGYVSGCVCSPSRVGLLTGRYQQRTGHDGNTTEPGKQLNINEVTIAQRMKELGYATGMFGKWHVGHYGKKQLPTARGFDTFVGSGGNLANKGENNYYEGAQKIDQIKGHPRTSRRWTSEALEFIEEHKEKPFFVYLPFHAVHTPRLSHKSNFVKYKHHEVMEKRRFAAVLDEMDECIGDVMKKLEKESLEENTLVFFISDNGVGKMKKADIKNGGLKGNKWSLWEGGIRVPFIMQWKGTLPANTVSETPVIQLDVLPTVVAAANGEIGKSWNLDGENLLPLFDGSKGELKRNALYWRFGTQYAIRKDHWKLVKVYSGQEKPMLVNLKKDLGEQKDLYNEHPQKAKELQVAWDEWNATMKPPRWEDKRWTIQKPK